MEISTLRRYELKDIQLRQQAQKQLATVQTFKQALAEETLKRKPQEKECEALRQRLLTRDPVKSTLPHIRELSERLKITVKVLSLSSRKIQDLQRAKHEVVSGLAVTRRRSEEVVTIVAAGRRVRRSARETAELDMMLESRIARKVSSGSTQATVFESRKDEQVKEKGSDPLQVSDASPLDNDGGPMASVREELPDFRESSFLTSQVMRSSPEAGAIEPPIPSSPPTTEPESRPDMVQVEYTTDSGKQLELEVTALRTKEVDVVVRTRHPRDVAHLRAERQTLTEALAQRGVAVRGVRIVAIPESGKRSE